ncbi:MAG: hypothetical protein U1E03_08570 [Hyphomonadaceae bacterium]
MLSDRMGHNISGVVARRDALATVGAPLAGQSLYRLADDFVFLPIDYTNLDVLVGASAPLHPFQYLSEPLLDLLRRASEGRTLVYVETDYFGGAGGQGSAVFRNERIRFGPEFTKGTGGAINDALAWLDVIVRPGHADAFETIGLNAGRRNDEFPPQVSP